MAEAVEVLRSNGGISESLLDAHSLWRLGLYLLIPLASWVGGAVVERLVDTALD